MVKEQTISAVIIEMLAGLCEKHCRDYETCNESCPEERALMEALWKYPITEVELDEERDLFVSEIEEEDEGDLECPEEHLKRNTCILNTDSGKVYCPHWDGCDSRSEKPWVYVPLK